MITEEEQSLSFLPAYVIVNDQTVPELKRLYLRTPCQEVKFPLSAEDKAILNLLEKKHDSVEENVTGLAAPQIGFNKRMIIFCVQEDAKIKKIFPDFEETMPRTIWINPSYMPMTDDLTTGYEFCLSVQGLTGLVQRFQKISYAAYSPEGKKVTGEATGFLARIIQHEIDHINGVLFIDKVENGSIITIKEFFEVILGEA